MPREQQFDLAGHKAMATGVCPVTLLDAFFTDHWDFDSLCAGFPCGECVAAPEDMGFGGPREGDEPAARFVNEEDWEIPF